MKSPFVLISFRAIYGAIAIAISGGILVGLIVGTYLR